MNEIKQLIEQLQEIGFNYDENYISIPLELCSINNIESYELTEIELNTIKWLSNQTNESLLSEFGTLGFCLYQDGRLQPI